MNLTESTGKEILEKLNNGEVSILKELGANDLKNEMSAAGALGKFVAALICMTKNDGRLRDRTIAFLKPFLPYKLSGAFPSYDGAIVIGFNHPSLGEIFRLLCIGFKAYPDRKFLFPVNLPWYEHLVPVIPKLSRIGVTIVPMITPSTDKKLSIKFAGNEEKLSLVRRIKIIFERNYMKIARSFAEDNGIIVVAPSATRQATVFSDHILPTMTLLAHITQKSSIARPVFIPVAVIEPINNNRLINVFKTYEIIPCEPFNSEEAKALSNKSRNFDYEFLKRIDAIYSNIKLIREQRRKLQHSNTFVNIS